MDPFDRSRNNNPVSSTHQSSFSFLTNSNTYPADDTHAPPQNEDERQDANAPLVKGPKRKRLAKACDACHKSKRRCDGTAPCSNCFYASKNCTYTDASGRPVPAPRPPRAERVDPTPSSNTRSTQPAQYDVPQFSSPPDSSHFPQHAHPTNGYPASASPSIPKTDSDEEERNRKRFRNERGNPVPAEEIVVEAPVMIERPARVELDPSLARELTNLFFTHCHPARAIIHKPTFSAALSHNSVPSYLLHAICALAAPLSKQPRIRTNPVRFAGKPFANEALSIMFDGAGRLVCELNLETAQALCLLQIHDVLTKDAKMSWNSRYHDLALQIVETLGVHSPEHPTLTPVPSPEFIQASIKREAVRRIFWLIHLLDVIASIYFKKSSPYTDTGLRLRLPADETSFEMGVHSTLPEYLYLPAVRTQYASEFGHLIRIVTIYAKLELALDEMNESEPTTGGSSSAALTEGEKAMEEWSNSLPEQLQFSQESLEQQRSMFETPSNMGAWCWCCMHVYHASCGLALNHAKQRLHRGSNSELRWATNILEMVLEMLGDRAKNSVLMAAALWSFIKYCKRDDQFVRSWCADYEETWGTRVHDLVVDCQPSPPPQNHFPSTSQPPHNRRADARQTLHHPGSGPHPAPHQHGGDTPYTNRRSPSSLLPNGHAPGRPTDEFRGQVSNNGNHNAAHCIPPHPQPVPGEREKPDGGFGGASNGTAGGGGVNTNQRGYSAEGPQSLPSLKSSGLLDSWTHANASQRSPRRTPPGHSINPDSELRPATLGMPVGLQWLANESR